MLRGGRRPMLLMSRWVSSVAEATPMGRLSNSFQEMLRERSPASQTQPDGQQSVVEMVEIRRHAS